MRSILRTILISIITYTTGSGIALAESYPEHPIKMIVPYPPGSGTDTIARYFAKGLEEEVSQPIVVENRPGGNAIIAAQAVARSKPDGYTLLWAANGPVTTNVAMHKSLPYDPLVDLIPVARVALSPMGFYVPADSQFETVDELFEYAKEHPGELNAGSGSATYNIATEWLLSHADAEVEIINYSGSAPAILAASTGEIDFTIVEYSAALSLVESGKLKLLAMTTDERFHAEPDKPTLQELGYGDFLQVAWWGVFAPKDTPIEIVNTLEDLFLGFCTSDEAKNWLEKNDFSQFCASKEELGEFQESEINREVGLVQRFNIPQI